MVWNGMSWFSRGRLVALAVVALIFYLVLSMYLEGSGSTTRSMQFTLLAGTSDQTINSNSNVLFEGQKDSMPGVKKILFWNDAYGSKEFFFGFGREIFVNKGCKVNACYATADRTLFEPHELDAVIWHVRSNDKSFPAKRYPHTRYVMWIVESAVNSYSNVKDYNGKFNWTMTYRSDSDFQIPAGRRRHLMPDEAHSSPRDYAKNKTKMAAWFVSNCHTNSKREMLVKNLQKEISVDIYGRCGKKTCSTKDRNKCDSMLENDYKFYLSFENSLCYDYITEKFVRPLRNNVVPVVYGLGYERYGLPHHSYIDVLDFTSIKELASYLKYLNSNDTAYNEYFRWKSEFTVDTGLGMNSRGFCDLCARLHEEDPVSSQPSSSFSDASNLTTWSTSNKSRNLNLNEENDPNQQPRIPGKHQTYKDLYKWFVEKQCTSPATNSNLKKFIGGLERPAGPLFPAPKLPIKGVFE